MCCRTAWIAGENGSASGAECIAGMLFIVSTGDAAGLEPGGYLADIFLKIHGGWPHSQLDDLSPFRWKLLQELGQ